MIVPAIIVILAGLGLIWLAVASWQERLPRNGAVLVIAGLLVAVLPKSTSGPLLLGGALACAAICIAGAVRGVRACRQDWPVTPGPGR